MEDRATSGFRWPDRNGPFEITLHWLPIEGRMECAGIDIRSFRRLPGQDQRKLYGSEPQAVTTSVLRSIPLARIIDEHRARLRDWPSQSRIGELVPARVRRTMWKPGKRGRPPTYGPEHFEEVARVYREAYEINRTPTRHVARHFKTTESAAAKWVARCRELGLLPKTTRGRARVVEPKRRRKR